MSNTFLISLFRHKAWANKEMFEAVRAVPEGAHPIEMTTIRFLLDHVSVVDRIFKARILGETPPFEGVLSPRPPRFPEMAEIVRETDQWFLDYVANADPAELSEPRDFVFVADGMSGRMTREEMLAHVITHGGSHRGAVSRILETIKVAGPPDMMTTFVRVAREADTTPRSA